MKKQYQTLAGQRIHLGDFDKHEQALLRELDDASRRLDWNAFDNLRNARLREFYVGRGLSPSQITRTPLYRVAQDLSSRIAIHEGKARPADYRDELEQLIRNRFKTQRAFCEATGLSEDMVSHVLARRKHIAIDTLNEALARIGFAVRIEKQPA